MARRSHHGREVAPQCYARQRQCGAASSSHAVSCHDLHASHVVHYNPDPDPDIVSSCSELPQMWLESCSAERHSF